MRKLVVLGCLCLAALGLGAGFSAAAFTSSTSVAGNGITADALRNYFSVTLAAGASTTLSVTTSTTVAGRGVGTLRLGLSGSSWLYRDYSFRLDEAPEAPGAPTAVQKPAGRIDLSWPASSTTTNFGGYDVYRSNGGAYTKINGTLLTTLVYSDTSTTD